MATSTDLTPLDQLPSGFELLSDPVLLFGEDMVDWNGAFADFCGRTPEELSTLTAADMFPEVSYARLQTHLIDLIDGRQSTAKVTLDIDGLDAVLECSLSRVPDDQSSEPRIIVVGHEVTEGHSRPPPIDHRTHALTTAHEIIADSGCPLDEKVDAILELVRETLDIEFATLSRVESETYVIEALTPPTGLDIDEGDSIPLDWTNCEHIVTTEQTLVLDDIEADPEFADKEANRRFELASYIGAPVFGDDGLYGTFCFYGRSLPDDGFSDWEVAFIDFLSNWISYEIEREQLLEQIRREERQRYETLVTQSSDGVVVVKDSVFSFVNERFIEITGYSHEELIGMNFEEVVSPESREIVSRRHNLRIDGKVPPSTYEIGVDSKTGERLEVELSVSRIEQDGSPAVLANVRDITRRKHHQQAVSTLQKATDQMQKVDQATAVAQIAADAGADALDLPYATCWFHDTETDLLEPVAATEIVKQQDRMVSLSTDRYEHAVFRRGEVTEYTPSAIETEASFEMGVLLPLGEHGLLAVGNQQSTDRDDLLIDVAQALADHTTIALDRIERTEQIRENERRFRAIFNHTYQFTGLMEPDGTVVEINDTALEFGGLDPSDVLGTPLWDTYWFGDDQQLQRQVQDAVDRAAAGAFVREELTVRGSQRMAVIDFSIRPVTDEDGDIHLLIPEGRDITELKEREKALRRERDHVRQTERLAAVGGWELNGETDVLLLTNGTRELFDIASDTTLTVGEALEFIHSEDRGSLVDAVDACRSTGESIDIELQTSTAVTRTQWLRITGERVAEDDHTVRGALRDISTRTERRQRLTVLNRILRHNLRNRLTVVTAYANELESKLLDSDDESIDQPAFSVQTARSQVETIQESTQDLLSVAEKVRSFEKVVDRADELEKIAVGPVLASLLDDFTKEYPNVEINAELVDRTVVGNEEILTLVVDELLTNAIQHSDRPNPRITVTVDDQVSSGTITVADDGPGIPKQERDVLRSGTETPLEHGNGIGLWTVQWLISRLGGHMEIRDNSPRGTAISLAMPSDHPA